MIDVNLPNDMRGYDGYMLIKFTSSYEYQQAFLDGKRFFNTADYFAQCDDEGRGDPDEGNTFIVDYENPNLVSVNIEKVGSSYALVMRDYSDTPEQYQRGTVWEYSAAINRQRKIICFYTAFVNIKEQQISSFDDRMKKEFGEFGVLILDRQTFFERVQTAICESSQNTQFTMGFVEYMPEEQHQGFIEWGPFTKKEKFNYQNEFRFTFVSDDTKPNTIDLGGSIRDIAVPIMMDDLNEIHFENGNLLYPMYRENHPLGNHITDNVPQP